MENGLRSLRHGEFRFHRECGKRCGKGENFFHSTLSTRMVFLFHAALWKNFGRKKALSPQGEKNFWKEGVSGLTNSAVPAASPRVSLVRRPLYTFPRSDSIPRAFPPLRLPICQLGPARIPLPVRFGLPPGCQWAVRLRTIEEVHTVNPAYAAEPRRRLTPPRPVQKPPVPRKGGFSGTASFLLPAFSFPQEEKKMLNQTT